MQSFWEEDRKNHKQYKSINNDIEVDICVIGAGLTGLSAAYYLSSKMSVAVVERDRICSKTSGNNTGKVTSQHGLFYRYLIQSEGEEFAKNYMLANEQAINNIEKIVENEKIDCDFKREDSFVFTTKDIELDKIKEEQATVGKFNSTISEFTNATTLPLKVMGAIKFKNQAKFHPIKYGYGLASCIEKNNGLIFENSQVTNVKRENAKVSDKSENVNANDNESKKNGKYTVYANNCRIVCNYVVVATRYPILNFPGFHFLKMYQSTSYAIVADTKSELFEGMYINVEVPTISFRVIEYNNKKLLLAVGYDYKTGTDNMINGYNELEKVVQKMYPGSEVLYKWFAEDCISLDKIPYIGRFSDFMPDVYIATGFNKWGLTNSNIAANIIKDDILNQPNQFACMYKSTRLKPIKNRKEVGNMLKQVNESLLMSKFKLPDSKLDEVQLGEGKVVEHNNKKVGVFKDEKGKIYMINPVCTHLGCELYFNNIDKIWECPCHGSKFTYDGKSIEVPSNKNIES